MSCDLTLGRDGDRESGVRWHNYFQFIHLDTQYIIM